MIEIDMAQNFFLEASQKTASPCISLPDFQVHECAIGLWKYVRTLFVQDSLHKQYSEHVVIWHQGKPVWALHGYGAFSSNEKRIVDLLLNARLQAYDRVLFIGGFGVAHLEGDDDLYYHNDVYTGNFGRFEGMEQICQHGITKLYPFFTCQYSGGLL